MSLLARASSMRRHDIMALARSGRGPIHFMGIGGDGMGPLAEYIARMGHAVTGCDLEEGEPLAMLAEQGADVSVGHSPDHIEDATALVVTAAVPPSHPEVMRARQRGIPVLKRAQALASVANRGRLLAVSGTHGKTTTTALAAHILTEAGLAPTAFVGGRVAAWGSNLLIGEERIFVVEADEYDRSFHALTPDVAIVTNMEADHLDTYGSLKGVREGFQTFLSRVRGNGPVIACSDDPGAASLLARVGRTAVTYGTSAGSMLRATQVRLGRGGSQCTVLERGTEVGDLVTRQVGLHNVRNALAAAAAARAFGATWDDILPSLESFSGVGRRFELVGEFSGTVVIDDYAHHPTEIGATLAGARAHFPGRRLVAAFQPHLYTRTRDFAPAFGTALARADEVWVSGIYPAREPPIPGITGQIVADATEAAGHPDVRHVEALSELVDALVETLGPGDVLITLGAGSIQALGCAVLDRMAGGEGTDIGLEEATIA